MEERELTQRIKSLSKAIQSQEAPTVVINMLENLKKDSAPTEEQLRASSLGRNRRDHPAPPPSP